MQRLSSIFVTVVILFHYSVISGENYRTAVGEAFGLQTNARPTAETKAPEPSAAKSRFTDNLMLVSEPAPGRPRERLRDRIRDRMEERRKSTPEPSAAFAPGLQPLPGPIGPALPSQSVRESRPLVERIRRVLGDLGLSAGSAEPNQFSPDWGPGTASELDPSQPGPMVQPNGFVAPAPRAVPPASPGPWLRSPDSGGSVSTPQNLPTVTQPPLVPPDSPSAATGPALPLLVPPDLPTPSQPSTGTGPSNSQVPLDMPAEDRYTDASAENRELDRPTEDAARNPATNSAGASAFGPLLGGVSRFFGGNSPNRDLGQAAQASESDRSDSTGTPSSPNSPSSSVERPRADATSTSGGGTSKPSLEDIRKKVLRRSSRSN